MRAFHLCRLLCGTQIGALIAPMTAAGQHEPRVVVLAPASLGTTAARVRGELRTRGFDAVVAPEQVAADRSVLEDFARTHDAIAVLLLRPSEQGIEVWVVDRLTRKTVLREVVRATNDDDETLARRAVEVLRASLLEIDVGAHTTSVVPAAVRAMLPRPASPTLPPWMNVALAPTLVWSPGGLGPLVAIDLHTEARVWRGLGVGVRARLPTLPATLKDGGLGSEQTLLWLGVAAAYHLEARQLDAWVAGGLSALSLRTSGSAPAPLVGVVEQRWVTSIEIELGMALRLARTFAIFASAAGLVALPGVTYVFVDRPVAHWGQPAIAATLGARIAFGD